MNLKHLTTAAFALTTFAAHAQLPAILAKLDTASAKFKNAQAQVKSDSYTKIVHDHSIETGSVYIERSGKTDTMGMLIFQAGSTTPSRIVSFDGSLLHSYTPGNNQDETYAAGNNQAKTSTFLTLGFGGSGKDLAANWNITDQGPETINGTATEKLDLVPKDPSVKNNFPHVTVWIDPNRGVSLRQIFFDPDGNTRTTDYTDIKLNAPVNKKPYAIPAKAQKIRH